MEVGIKWPQRHGFESKLWTATFYLAYSIQNTDRDTRFWVPPPQNKYKYNNHKNTYVLVYAHILTLKVQIIIRYFLLWS
jgi:hypothetical protein